MKALIKFYFLQFIILFSLVLPYSFTIISTDNFLKQEVSQLESKFTSTSFKSSDSLFSECNDDLEEFGLFPPFDLEIAKRREFISISLSQTFLVPQKIPFNLLSIPPPFI